MSAALRVLRLVVNAVLVLCAGAALFVFAGTLCGALAGLIVLLLGG